MKDHTGYEQRPLDYQDVIVVVACVIAVLAIGLILL